VSKCFKSKVLTRRIASLSHIKSQKSQISRKSQNSQIAVNKKSEIDFCEKIADCAQFAICEKLRVEKIDCDCAAIAKILAVSGFEPAFLDVIFGCPQPFFRGLAASFTIENCERRSQNRQNKFEFYASYHFLTIYFLLLKNASHPWSLLP
jgi:hypothetical protein